MSADNKSVPAKAAPKAAAPAAAVDPQDEINEIMNEIESLQKSMSGPETEIEMPKAAPVAAAATSRAAPAAAPAPKAAPAAAVAAPVAPVAVAEDPLVSELEADLADFRGSGDDASMEETLGSMQAEPAANSILDDDLKSQIESELQQEPQSEVDSLLEAEMAAETSRNVEEKAVAETKFDSDDELLQELEAITPPVPTKKKPAPALPPAKAEAYVAAPDHLADDLADLAPTDTATKTIRSPAETSFGGGESTDGTLTMSVAGSMQLKLKYEFDGQEVTLSFSDGALKICLIDGTEFKVPVGRARNLRAA
ncbi:MAG: hypothetical protein JNL01_00940 [Bdellovibrionales bacterium]|nr:hypothetical protein [Bdellovibrionales bacterium]